ncbi:MAG: addiction module protein [Nitrospirae bacterium]|nr:addiction module protein [Nitrospirota bacterium]
MGIYLEEIMSLSVPERVQLVEDIWDSIVAYPDEIVLTDSQRGELDRRLEAHRRNPHEAIPLEEALLRLREGL